SRPQACRSSAAPPSPTSAGSSRPSSSASSAPDLPPFERGLGPCNRVTQRPPRVTGGGVEGSGAAPLDVAYALLSAEMIVRQNAGRSSGLRDVIRLPSTTTSASTQLAPAATRSSLIEKKDVAFRPLRIPADTSIHPAWQIAATTLPCCAASRT